VGFDLKRKLEEVRARVDRLVGGGLWKKGRREEGKKGRKNEIKKGKQRKNFGGDGGYCQEVHNDGWFVTQKRERLSDFALMKGKLREVHVRSITYST